MLTFTSNATEWAVYRENQTLSQDMLSVCKFTDVPQFKAGIPTSAIAKAHQLKPSRTARKSVWQPTSIMQPTLQADSYRSVTKAICAVQASRRLRAAFFAYFFLLLKKSRSPKASEATNEAIGPNALDEQATHLLICAERKKKCQHDLKKRIRQKSVAAPHHP